MREVIEISMDDFHVTRTFSIKLSQLEAINNLSEFSKKNNSEVLREAVDLYLNMNRDLVEKAKKAKMAKEVGG